MREDEVAEAEDEAELAVGGDSGDRERVVEGAGEPRREIEVSLSRTYFMAQNRVEVDMSYGNEGS